jgi:hypothetical protein
MKTNKYAFTFAIPSIGVTHCVRTCARKYDAWVCVCKNWNISIATPHKLIDKRVIL